MRSAMHPPHVSLPQARLCGQYSKPHDEQMSMEPFAARACFHRLEMRFDGACLVADLLDRCGELFLRHPKLRRPVANLIVVAEADSSTVSAACIGLVVGRGSPLDEWLSATGVACLVVCPTSVSPGLSNIAAMSYACGRWRRREVLVPARREVQVNTETC